MVVYIPGMATLIGATLKLAKAISERKRNKEKIIERTKKRLPEKEERRVLVFLRTMDTRITHDTSIAK